MAKKRYSDEDRAACLAALAANGGNVGKTARQCGVPETTLRQWADGSRHPEASQMSEPKKGDYADRFDRFVADVLRLTTDDDIKAATLSQRFTALGIAFDKARLLRDQSTANVTLRPDLAALTDDDLETLDRLAARVAPLTG
jgi:transposase-like protein